jgi:hypothetical protein
MRTITGPPAPTVGFYGGLNYGYGYSGSGYQGGRWDHGAFRYNRAVSNVNINVVHNVYSAPLVNRAQATRVSFNGGAAGSHAQPTASERQMQAAEHAGPTPEQVQHEHQALTMSTQRAAVNHGVPPVAATPRPSAFAEPGVEQAKAAAVARTRQPGPTPREPVAAQSPPRPEAAPQREPPQLHAQVQQRAPQERAAPRAEPASRGEQQPRQEEPRR